MNSVYPIYKDKQNNIWFGTMQNITRYNRQEDYFTIEQETGTTTSCILEDAEGKVWFGTLGKGLYCFNRQLNKWEQFTYDLADINTLSNNQINGLCLDDKQQLWVGTDNGICRFDKTTGTFVRVPLDISRAAITSIVFNQGYL